MSGPRILRSFVHRARESKPHSSTVRSSAWWRVLLGIAYSACLPGIAASLPVIEGVTDQQVITDEARFRVHTVPDANDRSALNGRPVPNDTWITVSQPDYYELTVRREFPATGETESARVRFIVRASARGDSEWGLPAWTPYPVVPSSQAELAGATLRLATPRQWPAGMQLPVVAWLETSDRVTLRASGLLALAGRTGIPLRRGVGSGRVTLGNLPGPMMLVATLPPLESSRPIEIEAEGFWREVAGTLSGEVTWGPNARIEITNHLALAAGSSLRILAGSIVRLHSGVTLDVPAEVRIEGTADAPVVFLPKETSGPWGGVVLHGSTAVWRAEHAFFVGSGADPTWFNTHSGYGVHRKEQALFLVDQGQLTLTDCYALEGHGQFGHGRDGRLTLTRCLVQGFTTGGEFNGGTVRILGSAFIEFPRDDEVFVDGDNDAIYLTTGRHELADSLFGWAKDDGIDAGSGGAGSVLATNVWVESCFHEAFAWSGGGRTVTNWHCVALNCGQGIEAGWSSTADSPNVFATDSLSLGNLTGVRFGDNYDWTYNGFLRVTNSWVLYNYRDAWGYNWDDWSYRQSQMDLRGNHLTSESAYHPDNLVWSPDRDGPQLARFRPGASEAPVGLGFATRTDLADSARFADGLPVGLSCFSPQRVAVDYRWETVEARSDWQRLEFAPGETVKRLPLGPAPSGRVIRVTLARPQNAELTGLSQFHFVQSLAGTQVLIPTGSDWRYLDDGSNPGETWSTLEFDDRAWKVGPAELGFGDGDERTEIDGGPADARHATTYFRHAFLVTDPAEFAELEIRLRRDDGALVYLNDRPVFRSNLPEGPINSSTYTGTGTTSETAFFTANLTAALLRPGTNVAAVEVHQQNRTSSDLSFELELVASRPPRLNWERFGPTLWLFWGRPEFLLERAETIPGPWVALPDLAGAYAVPAGSAGFYRLRAR